MSSDAIGPRRRALLTCWGDHVANHAEGSEFDFTDTSRTARTQQATAEFIDDPSVETFESLWSPEILTTTLTRPASKVYEKWDGGFDELAELFDTIRATESFDEQWEDALFPSPSWELHGRLHPEVAPVIHSEYSRAFAQLGFSRESSYSGAAKTWEDIAELYTFVIGHATKGTAHEVPLNEELSQFLWVITHLDDEELTSEFTDQQGSYHSLQGWREEGPLVDDITFTGLDDHIAGYVQAKRAGGFERDGPEDEWNRGHFEAWKDQYHDHFETVIHPRYDLTDLAADDIDQLIDDLDQSLSISTPIPAYILGGQTGSVMWRDFKAHSVEHPAEAASVLSSLYDEEESLGIRLDRFATFYRPVSDGGAPMLTLATILLGFSRPNDYVIYKYSLMRPFFEAFGDFTVRTGMNADQYWKVNTALKNRVLTNLRKALSDHPEETTMLDVHSLLYVWERKYRDS